MNKLMINRLNLKIIWFIIFIGIIIPQVAFCQEITLQVGTTTIGLNEDFEVTVTVKDGELKKYSDFPKISGMDKAEIYTSQSINFVNGQVSKTQAVTQRYRASRQGTYFLRPFDMTVNGEKVRHAGASIDVKGRSKTTNPFDSFWGKTENTEYISVKDDAFFAITTNKQNPYVGEGFTLTMSFYVAVSNRATLNFYELGEQKAEILKQIRPKNALEENFNIIQPVPEMVKIRGKEYRQYKVYQAVFYSLSPQEISIPAIPFKMVKYDVAVNSQSIFNQMKENIKTYYSEPVSLTVKALPPHPLKDQVPVGNYILKEQIASKDLKTGESVQYQFRIEGEGNLSVIEKPNLPKTGNFDFYEPTISEMLRRNNNAVYGKKDFNYYIIPNEPGTYEMKDYFSYIFFNTKKEDYDTLSSKIKLKVTGESRKNASIGNADLGSFYDRINEESNTLRSKNEIKWEKYGINGIALLLALVLGLSVLVGKKIRQRDLDKEE
ncbi:BatD family protein [Bernardetia sp. ABR2-2B]|uniref:BatD family protein n=1 Tax=Bernardetia sp. ABR2-2B TaxID=3127472 RepID=UPI0030CEE79F